MIRFAQAPQCAVPVVQMWSLIFLNFAIQAHATNIYTSPEAPDADALVCDRPLLRAHWPKFLLWCGAH